MLVAADGSTVKRARVRYAAMPALAAAATVALLAGCGGGGGGGGTTAAPAATPSAAASSAASEPAAPTATAAAPKTAVPTEQKALEQAAGFSQDYSTIATVRGASVAVYRTPLSNAPDRTFAGKTENGAPRVFLAIGRTRGWYQVLLPIRPNGTSGWVKEADVAITSTRYRIEVRLTAHRLALYQAGKIVREEPIAVGKSSTPTPGGRYYLTELLQPPNPAGDYGPYAYGISGYSTTLSSFRGKAPVIGIHGTNHPELLGSDVSSGCIRLSNTAITQLARTLPLGTPVSIVS